MHDGECDTCRRFRKVTLKSRRAARFDIETIRQVEGSDGHFDSISSGRIVPSIGPSDSIVNIRRLPVTELIGKQSTDKTAIPQ